MIISFLKYALCFVVITSILVISYLLYTIIATCQKQKRLQHQGVYFSGTPLHSLTNDYMKLRAAVGDPENKDSTALDSLALFESLCPGPNKPPFIGINMVNEIFVYCTDPKVTSKIFVDRNRFHSKC